MLKVTYLMLAQDVRLLKAKQCLRFPEMGNYHQP